MKQTSNLDKKASKGVFSGFETFLEKWLVPKIPRGVETYHLTLTTILWSLLIIVGSYLASKNISWMWFVSLMIFLQYITDFVDGKIGKLRGTGLVKWGYYMDHFLDYVFLSSIIIGYALLIPESKHIILLITLAIYGSFMVNSFLSFSATGEFKIHYLKIGPTEVRLVFILLNSLIILFGQTYLIKSLPYVFGFSIFGLVVVVYRTQRKIWKLDEKIKGEKIN